MLVKIVDSKDKIHFVNPLYIKSVVEKKPGQIEVHGSFSGLSNKLVIKNESLEALSDRISIALTTIGGVGTAIINDQAEAQANTAASGAAMAG